MTLSWEEYQETVPKETLDFTRELILFCNNDDVVAEEVRYFSKSTIRFLKVALVAYNKTLDIRKILLDENFGKIDWNYSIPKFLKINKEDYQKYIDWIPTCNSFIEYEQLIPEDFFLYHLRKVSIWDWDAELPRIGLDGQALMDKVKELRITKNTLYREQLEKKIFENCSYSVISFFKTASQIASYYDDIKAPSPASFSLFLALYFYQGTEQTVILNALEDKGIGYNEMISSFGKSCLHYQEYYYDIYQIEHDYRSYLEDKEHLSIPKIVEKMASMSFDGSTKIMDFLNKHGLDIDDFKNFTETYEEEKMISQEDCWQEMSFSLQNDVKELLEDSTQIYSYLVDTLENKPTKYLKSKDDADTLALFLASFSNPTTLNQFFENHGVTYDDICHLLKIPVEKDKIIEPSFKEKTLVRRFLRFLISGENKGKDIDKITVFDVVQNLVNRRFNKSFVMESLFYELGDGTRPFEEKYMKYVQNVKLEEEKELRNQLFANMNSEMITFWENVSRCYDYFMKENCLNKHGRKFYSIIYAGINVPCLKDFWEWSANGLLCNSEALAKVLKDEGMVISIGKNDAHLNLLMNDFGDYFKQKLGLIDVLDQAVAEEMELSPHGITIFEPRLNTIKSFRKYYEIYSQEKHQQLGKQIFDTYPIEVQKYLSKVLNTYLNVKGYFEIKYDACLYSFLYATLDLDTEEAKYLSKNHITKEALNEKEFSMDEKEMDYSLLVTDLAKYFLNPKAEQKRKDYQFVSSHQGYCSKSEMISSLFQEIFDKEICPSTYLEKLCEKVGCNYQILKMEVCSLKDYVLLVSPEERMKMLEETPVEPLIADDIQSILHFGDNLSVHSSAIHEEYPKLMLNDSSEKAIIELNELMNKVIPKEKPKTFSFLSLFRNEEKSEGLNEEGIQELKKAIDENLKILSKELVVLEQLLKYINIYRTKNEEYANRLHLAIANKEQERTLLEKDDDILKPMQYQSLLQILKDKENRFLTTKNLMNQELLKLYQTITNHFITINALEMAKNDFIPVIYSEFIIGKSRDSENEALELSRKMMNLLQDVISRNLAGAEQNIEALKNSSLSKDVVEMLNQDITLYIENTKRMSFNESDSSHEQGVKLVLTNEKSD